MGLQGIDMAKTQQIEEEIMNTFLQVAEDGFEEARVEAILNRTELSLKKHVDDFGWKLILALTAGWNHVKNPLSLLQIGDNIDRFKRDIKDPNFLKSKVRQYFVDNNHRLVLTMSPKSEYLADQQRVLDDLEERLVTGLTEEDRARVIAEGKELEKLQGSKDNELISSLPTLTIQDIPDKLPRYTTENRSVYGSIRGGLNVQPTNGVAYFRAMLNADPVLDDAERELVPLFTAFLSSMGAGKKSYRDLDTQIELHTGGLGATYHVAEDANSAASLVRQGVLLSSTCLEKNTPKMFDLWKEIFEGVLVESNSSPETSRDGLKARLLHLINMSAVDGVNGLAYSGHHYAMTHAASRLPDLPALMAREKDSGLSLVRLLNRLTAAPSDQIEDVYQSLASMARKILAASRIEDFAVNVSLDNAEKVFAQADQSFIKAIGEGNDPICNSGKKEAVTNLESSGTSPNSYIAAPFPVHFCSVAVPGTPCYTHPDSAALRVVSRLLSSKYLHVEIREKGGAYGGGVTANPTAGVVSFYSYRDPNFTSTLDAFRKSNEWIQRGQESFCARDVDEAKLSVFKAIDRPVLPGDRGVRQFLSGVTDDMLAEHRERLREVTVEDVRRISEKYLGPWKGTTATVIGPESSAQNVNSTWNVEPLLN